MKSLSSILVGLMSGVLVGVWATAQGVGGYYSKAGALLDTDRQEILDLISNYSYTWDGKDAEGFTALFVEDATQFNYSDGNLTSITRSRKERLARAHERFQSFTSQGIQTRHYPTNTILEKLPNGTVRGTTVFQVLWQYAAEPAPKLVHSGIYRDTFIKTSSAWKFASREVRGDHR
jgi:hypothetical protein